MIKLMIADDDAIVRSAINLLLDQDRACWQVIAEVRNVNELFLMVEQEKPQLLLLDWELPEDRCGDKQPPYYCLKDRIHHLRELNPEMYIIVLSSKPQVKSEALESGANSFVSKGDPPEIFLSALYAICEQPSAYITGQPKKVPVQHNFSAILL
ncbi:MAG: response regulator transcription factor [Anaerolineaceae bacterium]|nr:response regulator transcription factor [Anaerolineaceae bacterium]